MAPSDRIQVHILTDESASSQLGVAHHCAQGVPHASVTPRRKLLESRTFLGLGTPKCMIGDLGVMAGDAPAQPPTNAAVSAERRGAQRGATACRTTASRS